MRNHRLLAHITAALLMAITLAACGGPAAIVPTAAPTTAAPAPTAAPAAIPPATVSIATAPTAAGQPAASLGELVWKTMGSPNKLNSPFSLAVDGLGNVYVVDNGENRIQKYDSKGTFVTMWGK